MLSTLKFRSGEPFLARYAGRAAVGTMNMIIISLISSHLRAAKYGAPMAEAAAGEVPGQSVDTRSTQIEGALETQEREHEMHAEQGLGVDREPPLHVAARIRLVRDSVAKSLDDNAGTRVVPVINKTIKDPWHTANPLVETLNWQLTSTRPLADSTMKAVAKALGITEAEVKQAYEAQQKSQALFLSQNRDEVISIAQTLIASDREGYALSSEQDEQAFAAFPAMVKLNVAASASRALARGKQREIQQFMRNADPEAMSNCGVIDGERRNLWAEVEAWHKDAAFEREMSEALANNARLPDFGPKPAPAQEQVKKAA